MKDPIVEGFVYAPEKRLVVPKCPYCGKPHLHGWASEDEKIGTITHRISHCLSHGYYIKVIGFLTREEYRKIERKLTRGGDP